MTIASPALHCQGTISRPMKVCVRLTSCARCVESNPYMARLSDVAAGIERRCFARLHVGSEAGWTW